MKKTIIALMAAALMLTMWSGASASAQNASVSGTVLDRDYRFQVEYQTTLVPNFVCLDQNDQIFAINNDGDTIYQVWDTGEVSAVFSLPGQIIACIGFDSENTLWFTTGARQLYKVDGSGNKKLVVRDGANRLFRIDSQDNLFAVDMYGYDKTIQIISPEGTVKEIAWNMDISYHAIGPDDTVLVLNYKGEILQIEANGRKTVIGKRDSFDAGLAMAPNGMVFLLDDQIRTLDIETGTIMPVAWYAEKYGMVLFNADFDSAGRMYLYSGNTGLYRVDFQARTVKQILSPRGSTMAMTVNGVGNVYLAYGDNLPGGTSTVYQVDEGKLTAIATVPGGIPRGLAASGQDTLYIATEDRETVPYIYSLNLLTGKYKKVQRIERNLDSLLVHPKTGRLWWSIRYDKVYYINSKGDVSWIRMIDNPDDIFLDFGPDGTLYAVIWKFRTVQPGPGPHSLYKLGEQSAWVELADMLTQDPGIWWALPVTGLDGSVYSVASIDGKMIANWRSNSSFDAVLRLDDDGGFTLIGYDFPYDCMAAACDPNTGDILFSHSSGVYRMTPPAAK
ncbi:MAG: hypothetical protein JW811_02775 [Clostridiales bacterium]|nr:hypothetical protein [Clostridiales bacterium]